MNAVPLPTAPTLQAGSASGGPRSPTAQQFLAGLILALLGMLVQTGVAFGSMAPGGAPIAMRAYADYLAPDEVQVSRVYSNDAVATVAIVEAVIVSGDARVAREPAARATIPFTVTNAGNVASDYTLSLTATGCGVTDIALSSPSVVLDLNNNGVADPGEPSLSGGQTLHVAAGQVASLLVTANLPNVVSGRGCLDVSAASSLQGAQASSSTTVVVGAGAAVTLTETASYAGALVPGASSIGITVLAQNAGSQSATPTATGGMGGTILVDGSPRALVLVRVPVPAGAQYVTGSVTSSLAGALKLVRLPGDPPYSFRTVDDASAIEVAIGIADLPRDSAVAMNLGFALSPISTTDTPQLLSQAHIAYTDAGGPTEIGSNTVVLPIANDRIGVALGAGVPVAQVDGGGRPDGTAIVHLAARLKNFGGTKLYAPQLHLPLEGVSGTERLGAYTSALVPAVGSYTVVPGTLRITNLVDSGTVAAINPQYTGVAGADTLLLAGGALPGDGDFTVEFDARINFSGRGLLYVRATGEAGRLPNGVADVTDDSVNGTDPDPAGTLNPELEASVTPIAAPPALTVAVSAGAPRAEGGGVYEIDYRITVTNATGIGAPHVRVIDNLSCALLEQTHGAISAWQIVGTPVAMHGRLAVASSFTGSAPCASPADPASGAPLATSLSLTDGAGGLAAGQSEEILLTVRATLQTVGGQARIDNRVWASSLVDASAGIGAGTVVAAGTAHVGSILIDPSGFVYDAVTRVPIAGAPVRLARLSCPNGPVTPITAAELYNGSPAGYTFASDGSVSMPTLADGSYQFQWQSPPIADDCTYSISVGPPPGTRYVSPSTVLPPETGTFSACGAVVPASGAPAVGSATRYFPRFVSGVNSTTGAACEVIHNNLPLDPITARVSLLLKKEANKADAEVGDFVDYTLTVYNKSGIPLPGIAFNDVLPAGFVYARGSARFQGGALSDPVGGGGPALVWSLPDFTLATDASATLRYRVRIGVGSPTRGDAINRARASSNSIQSNEASWKIRVGGGAFAEDAYAFGKVYLDCNADRVQGGEGEVGIPGVRLFLETGTSVITDSEGRYSVYGLKPVTHVMHLDGASLPAGGTVEILDARNAGDPMSRFLDLKNGEFGKADFAITGCDNPALLEAVGARRATPASGRMLDALVRSRLDAAPMPTVSGDLRALPSTGAVASAGGATGTGAVIARPLIGLPEGLANAGVFGSVTPLAPIVDARRPFGVKDAPRVGGADLLAPLAAADAETLELLVPKLDPTPGFVDFKDGDRVISRAPNIRVKGPAGASLWLTVNGEQVPDLRVGKRAELASTGVAAWEYVGVALAPGVNHLVLEVVDPFGVIRSTVPVDIVAPDKIAVVTIDVPAVIRASPRAPIDIVIRLSDANGVPVTARTPVSLEADRGRWLDGDVVPGAPGTQVFIEGGVGHVRFEPPTDPGAGRLRATSNLIRKELVVDFLPTQQPMSGVGIVEGVVDLSHRGRIALGDAPPGAAFESELTGAVTERGDARLAGRTAFYFKGTIKGDALLTTAYDSAKDPHDPLFRDIRPDQYYPVYGDDSVKAYDAQSTQKFYVRIDKNRSYLLYGDFTTTSSPEVRQLSQVSRSLTGVKQQYDTGKLRVTSFLSHDSTTQQVEELRANGTSFYLIAGTGDVVPNSEKVEVLVRSRSQPEIVLSSTTLERDADYTFETLTHRLLLVNPVGSFDADLNPQSIRLTYEVQTGGPEFVVAGTDAQLKLGDHAQVGIVEMRDRNPADRRSLEAATALVRLGDSTVVAAEEVRTTSDEHGDGRASRLEIRHSDGALRAQVQVLRTDATFDNPSASTSAGRTEGTARAEYQVSDTTRMRAEATYGKNASDTTTAAERQNVSVALQHKMSPTVVGEVALRHGNDTGTNAGVFDYGQVAGTSSGSSATTTAGATEGVTTTTVRGRVTEHPSASPQTELFAEVEQDVEHSDRNAVAVGGAYALTSKTRLYGREEILSHLYGVDSTASQHTTTVLGLDSAYMDGGRLYNEYRVAPIGGQNATGVRNTFRISPAIRLGVSFEHVTASGGTGTGSGASTAGTLGLDYGAGPWRLSTAAELRNASDASSRLYSVGAAYKVTPDWTALARSTTTTTDGQSAGRHVLERHQLGFAWRPAASDVWNGLVRLEDRYEQIGSNSLGQSSYGVYGGAATATSLPGTYRTWVLTGLTNYAPSATSTWTGRYAAKVVSEDDGLLYSSSWAQLVQVRYTRDLGGRWDAGFQGGLMIAQGGSKKQTLGVEVGYQVIRNLWASVGLNVLGLHDPDLAGADYTNQGVYLRLRFKFDETTLGLGESGSSRTSSSPTELEHPVGVP